MSGKVKSLDEAEATKLWEKNWLFGQGVVGRGRKWVAGWPDCQRSRVPAD